MPRKIMQTHVNTDRLCAEMFDDAKVELLLLCPLKFIYAFYILLLNLFYPNYFIFLITFLWFQLPTPLNITSLHPKQVEAVGTHACVFYRALTLCLP